MPEPTAPTNNVEESNVEAAADPWEPVELPGTLDAPAADKTATTASTITPERENELLILIHDLNDCNDALLARVSQLEASLQKAHQVIQSNASQNQLAQAQMAEQVSAQQAAAQLVSQNAQQQVAQLVAQLENTENALQRQQLVNENLQAELTNSQERITQLEHEGALSAQQHATEAQARIQAENSNRDLRSRLQRQQRYTLQFKAALEKSLSVSARSPRQTISSNQTISSTTSFDTGFDTGNVNMPKARRIMPWASVSSAPAFEGIDPHLENLIRGASQPASEPVLYSESPIIQPPVPLPLDTSPIKDASVDAVSEEVNLEEVSFEKVGDDNTADSAAEAQLWHDLERVMDDPNSADSEVTGVAKTTVAKTTVAKTTVAKTTPTKTAAEQPEQIPPFPTQAVPAAGRSLSPITSKSLTDSEIDFTEPSPWGEQPLPSIASSEIASGSKAPVSKNEMSAVAPVVEQLRSPKKPAKKLSSIQLPTFETAKAGSFKR